MGQDLELQQHLAELKRSGQPELTRQERITRQRALDKLNVPSFIKTCKVWFGGGEELTRQEHMSTSRGRGRSTSWTSTTKICKVYFVGGEHPYAPEIGHNGDLAMGMVHAADSPGCKHHSICLQDRGVSPLVRGEAKTLQLNIGLYCNQACTHCHVESSPKRCAPEMSGVLSPQTIRLGASSI